MAHAPKSTKSTSSAAPSAPSTPSSTVQEATVTANNHTTVLVLSKRTQKGVSAHIYEIVGRRGLVYIPASFWAVPPATLTVPTVEPESAKKIGVKMTAEEKAAAKAARAAETPAQKAARARKAADVAKARAEKLEAAVPATA